MEKVRIHVYISGYVQGVFFRSNTKDMAERFNLTGWVKNLPDGRVEVMAEGEKDKIEEFIRFLKRGPSFSRVEDVEIKIEKFSDEFDGFSIIH